ncbi:MAG: deoxyribose-phosphate aldolase [Lachnospiraceae bacterium]|nr:deoxyribose-phosphate aldolase [Lachnospiraceae bacterium]
MEREDIAKRIDHTLLKPFATMDQIDQLCDEAIRYGCASVCIPPCYIKRVKDKYGADLRITTVIGFPLGYMTTEAKVAECKDALLKGADEIDMVVNVTDIKNGDMDLVKEEIRQIKEACGDHILKVILENCYLEETEIAAAASAASDAGADYVKTSTGFGTGGAKLDDIEIMRSNIRPDMKIKAAGGIRTREAMESFCEAGCDRIGCSSTSELFRED